MGQGSHWEGPHGFRIIVESADQVELWTATETQQEAEAVALAKLDELAALGSVARAQVLTTEGLLVWEGQSRKVV